MHQAGGECLCHNVVKQLKVPHSWDVGDQVLLSERRAKSLILPMHNTSFYHHNNPGAA